MSEHKQTAKVYFDSNPSENVIHISSDGQVFFQNNYNDARNHQLRIDAKTSLVSVYRKDLIEQIDSSQTKADISEWLNKKGFGAHWQGDEGGTPGESGWRCAMPKIQTAKTKRTTND